MMKPRDDNSLTSSKKKKKGMRWPFFKRKKKEALLPDRPVRPGTRSPMRGPTAAVSNGTPPSPTSSTPYRRQDGMGATVPNGGNRHNNIPARFRRSHQKSELHEVSQSVEANNPAFSYKVPMKDGGLQRPPSPPSALSTSTSNSNASSRPPLRGTALFCRTNYFKKACDNAFDAIDVDGSGFVDEKELYSGLLLIHLKLGMYMGPAACRPLERKRCTAIFERMDVDQSGNLDREEFRHVMMFLFGNVLLRVIVQWSMTITIVPLVAQQSLNALYACAGWVYETITTLDEHSLLANWIEVALEAAFEFFLQCLPGPVLLLAGDLGDLLEQVPDSVWNALPLTLLSSILGIIVVPAIIFKIDDFFQWLVRRKSERIEGRT